MIDKKDDIYKKLQRAIIMGDFVESITSANDNHEPEYIIPEYYIDCYDGYPFLIELKRYKKR